MEFPRMVYRGGGECVLESGRYSLRIVADEADLEAARAEGWYLDQYAAKEAHEAEAAASRLPKPPAAPTRDDLETEATALGVKFDGRVSDKTLSERIAAKKEQA